jgi:hypothetical protein
MDLPLTKLGASYKASRLFPPSQEAAQTRVIVLENRASGVDRRTRK